MRLSEQEVSRRRARLAVATTQARALAREVHRLRAEILSGEASDDGPDPRQLELPEVSPGLAPAPAPALAQAEPTRQPTLLERLTLAEPVRCLLTPVERALSPGALALYRELYSLRETGDRRHVPSGGVLVEGLDLELVYELLAYSLVTAVLDVSGQLVALSPSLIPEVVVDEPTDGEALEQLAQELEEAGTVAQLRDAVRLPTVVVRAGLRALEQMGVLELDGDRYWRRTTVLAVEEAVLEAIRLGAHTWGAVVRSVSCPGSLVEWSLAELHEDGRVVVRDNRICIATDPPQPLTDGQVDDLVADEVGRSSTVPSSPQTVARWAHLSLSTVRSSLARLALVGRVVEVTSVSGLEYKLAREAAKASKPAKAKGKAKTTAEAKP